MAGSDSDDTATPAPTCSPVSDGDRLGLVSPLPGCRHASCANCLRFALAWRERLLAVVAAAERTADREGLFDD